MSKRMEGEGEDKMDERGDLATGDASHDELGSDRRFRLPDVGFTEGWRGRSA